MNDALPLSHTSSGRVVPERLLETHLARVLFSAQRRGRTGVLTVDQGPVHTRLRLVDGKVVFAEAGTLSETLGRVLMRSGIIEREEYLLILERMAEPSDQDEVLRFGDVAIQLGMLSPAELGRALEQQMQSKLQHCLQLDDVDWAWRDDPATRHGTQFPVRLEPCLRAALRDDPQSYRWVGLLMSKRHHRVRLDAEPDVVGRRFGATAAELRFLMGMETHAVGEILHGATLEPTEIAALLVALMFADLVSLEPAAPAQAAPAQAVPVDPAPARRSPEPARRPEPTPEPERKPKPRAAVEPAARHEAERARDEARHVERAREAAERLREEMKRRGGDQPPSQRARIQAEQAFEQGRKLLAVGGVNKALDHFEKAARLMPEAVDYVLHLRWCEYLVDADELRRPVREQELRGAVLEALRQDRKLGFAHYVQGRLHLLEEDLAAADKCFFYATRLAPDDMEAQRYLMLVRRRLDKGA